MKTNDGLNAAVAEVVTSQMTGKKWYRSKTFWANIVMACAVAVQAKFGFVMGPELQALAITGINMVLRKITKDEIVW
jgi:hypothetical protein